MKVLAFAASSSQHSINKSLVRHAAERLRAEFLPDVELEHLALEDLELPVYSVDREREGGVHPRARAFFDAIGSADALLISYAEHNGNYSAAFKNLFDWASRIDPRVFQGKPTVALSTSPGGRGGASALKLALAAAPRYGAEIVSSLSIPRFHDSFDREAGALRDAALAGKLGAALKRLADHLAPTRRQDAITPAFSAAEWDERYAQPFASYGAEPNDFVRAVAGRVPPGPVLVIAAGEGRDAVFFAERGHEVTAVDLSRVALDHAEALARERGVTLTTVAGDLADFDLGESRWAAIVSVWAHVPPALRRTVHAACARALQPGGVFILEIYAPAQLELPGAGGPSVVELLLDVDAARQELQGLELELCQETRRLVAEGQHHRGVSATTQVLGARPA